MGLPGWILLTHNEEGKPVALFKDTQNQPISISMVMDERICSDTVLRVVKIGKEEYVVYDIEYFNGRPLFDIWNYERRYQTVVDILDNFHCTDLCALIPVENVQYGTTIRGYECYDDQPGTMGVFLPVDT